MSKFVRAAIASAFVFTAVVPNTASATALPPVVVAGTSSAAGAAAVGGFLGFVAFLDMYDIIRRTTCSGDFLNLGGPGFTEPMPNGNVMIPQCKLHKHKHVRH
jgi:hypothetical protein